MTKNLKRIFDFKLNFYWLVFVLLVMIYGIFNRFIMEEISIYNRVQYNIWDIFFKINADVFFLMYILIPIWFIMSIITITDRWNFAILIRLTSYKKWIIHNLVNGFHYALLIQGLLILCVWSISFEFPITNQWSSYSKINLSTQEMFLSDNTPLYYAAIQILYLTLFLVGTFIFFALICRLLQRKNLLFTIGLLIYLGILILYKYNFSNYYLNPLNYVSILNTYQIWPSLIHPLVFYLVFIIGVFIVGSFKKS